LNNDSRRFEELYREHFDFVFRIAARLGNPDVDPEDVAQEVFIIAFRRLDTFDGTSQMSTWLYSIVRNVVRTSRRKAWLRNRFWAEESAGEDVPLQSVDAAEVREAYDVAYDILEKLSDAKRETFILAELEGMSHAEIAAVTGAKVETVWSRLHYARQEFEKRLAKRRQRRK
jgi:RNA polymerase sigma-70 factor (ECF subfamily)